MAKVIQVRGVPDDVHAALIAAADEAGKSLTVFVREALTDVVRREDPVAHNRQVVEKLRADLGVIAVPRDVVRRIIDEGREDRVRSIVERYRQQGA